jgi:hypothetical protein
VTETDLSDWLPIADAAAILRCSIRTVERRFREWHIEQRMRPQAGSPAVAVYNPDDVQRKALEKRREVAPFVLPADQGLGTGNGHGRRRSAQQLATVNPPVDDLVRQFFALAVQALQSPPLPPVAESVAETPWVDIPAAAAILGRSQAYVRRRIKEGKLHAERDRCLVVRRKDVEHL